MTLGEFNSRPLSENLADMTVISMKVFTDPKGKVTSVELKYISDDIEFEEEGKTGGSFRKL